MKKSILVIDDEAFLRGLLAQMLEECGYEVKTAGNGLEGLKILDACQWHVIITDVDMPVMNGINFYRELVVKAPLMKEKVFFLSGSLNPKLETFIRETGRKLLLKPFKIDEIIGMIDSISADIKDSG